MIGLPIDIAIGNLWQAGKFAAQLKESITSLLKEDRFQKLELVDNPSSDADLSNQAELDVDLETPQIFPVEYYVKNYTDFEQLILFHEEVKKLIIHILKDFPKLSLSIPTPPPASPVP